MLQTPVRPPAEDSLDDFLYGETIIARDVPVEAYLSGQFGEHAEWVRGVVIQMSPVSLTHNRLNVFLIALLNYYLEVDNLGEVFTDPFVMQCSPDLPARQPDIGVVLANRAQYIQNNRLNGPANLVIEIVSPESAKRDRSVKFEEYEQGGVQEYWIVDPLRHESLFYVMGDDGLFHPNPPVNGIYTSVALPRLALSVELFWQTKYPSGSALARLVEAMFKDA